MRQGEVVPYVPKIVAEDETGQWRLYELEDRPETVMTGGGSSYYRGYHKHEEVWIQQLVIMPVCPMCRAEAPKEMQGFKKLLEWER